MMELKGTRSIGGLGQMTLVLASTASGNFLLAQYIQAQHWSVYLRVLHIQVIGIIPTAQYQHPLV